VVVHQKYFFQVDGRLLLQNSFVFSQLDNYPLCFKPVIDDFSSDPFFPKESWDMIEEGNYGKKQIIIGNNQDEGLLTAINFHLNSDLLQELAKNWNNQNGPLFLFSRYLRMKKITALKSYTI